MEVALALALLGVVAITFLTALATGSKAIFFADERATAESLARTHMEYVRSQAYSMAPWDYEVTLSARTTEDPPTWWDPDNDIPPLLDSEYSGYTAVITATLVPDHTFDDAIQQITVVIKHLVDGEQKEIFDLDGYRSLR